MDKDASLFSSLDIATEKKIYVVKNFHSILLVMVISLVNMVILSTYVMFLV